MVISKEYIPFLIPLVIIQVTLTVASIIHIVKHNKFKFGNKIIWIIVSFIQFIGPILYFTIGRSDE